jgi:protein required for attachment to host cells
MTVWVLLANATSGTLYETESIYTGPLTLLKKFSHPESRQKDENLISDSFGNYHEKNSPGSAFERVAPKKIEGEKFARQLADALYKGYTQHQYKQLFIVAEPHFYGLLKKQLPKTIHNVSHLDKEYIDLPEKDLLHQLKEHCRMHML